MSEYKNCIDKMRWSYSRLSCFEHCKYEFYLNYIIANDDIYLSEGNYYAEIGSYIHEILAKIFEGELKPNEALQYFIDNYNGNVFYSARESIMDKTYQACIDYFTYENFDWLKDFEILGVEREIKYELDGYEFIGFIDLLLRDKRDGKIVVVDHKSSPYPLKQNGGVKKSSEKNFNSYKKQMYLYSYAVKQIYGEFPKEIRWNHFKDGGKFATIEFSQNEYDEVIKWFTKTIHRIKNEDDFNPSVEYFYCTNLCNFRNSCEYKTNG